MIMFWAGYKWGFHRAILQLIKNYLDDPKNMEHAFKKISELKADMMQEEHTSEVEIEAKVEGGQVYLWRKDTMEFLAQGASIDDALVAIGLRHQGSYRIPKETVDRVQAELPKNL
jgi:hypothetical protein